MADGLPPIALLQFFSCGRRAPDPLMQTTIIEYLLSFIGMRDHERFQLQTFRLK